MTDKNWLESLYINTKQAIKMKYNQRKESVKESLEFIGIGQDTESYQALSKIAHVTEPIFSGMVETGEFLYKNRGESWDILKDFSGWAITGSDLDAERFLNYLCKYSKETGSDVKKLLRELPPDSLSDILKYVNHKLSELKNIPCSKVCMDIALSNPDNLHEEEYQTIDKSKIRNLIEEYRDTLSADGIKRFGYDYPLVEFKANGKHAQMLQNNDQLQKELYDWAKKPENERSKYFNTSLNSKSDSKNGYDSYATFHKISVLNPTVNEDGSISAYVFDVYDFQRASFNDQILDIATIMAYHLQESGHLKNYQMLIPITIPAEKD